MNRKWAIRCLAASLLVLSTAASNPALERDVQLQARHQASEGEGHSPKDQLIRSLLNLSSLLRKNTDIPIGGAETAVNKGQNQTTDYDYDYDYLGINSEDSVHNIQDEVGLYNTDSGRPVRNFAVDDYSRQQGYDIGRQRNIDLDLFVPLLGVLSASLERNNGASYNTRAILGSASPQDHYRRQLHESDSDFYGDLSYDSNNYGPSRRIPFGGGYGTAMDGMVGGSKYADHWTDRYIPYYGSSLWQDRWNYRNRQSHEANRETNFNRKQHEGPMFEPRKYGDMLPYENDNRRWPLHESSSLDYNEREVNNFGTIPFHDYKQPSQYPYRPPYPHQISGYPHDYLRMLLFRE